MDYVSRRSLGPSWSKLPTDLTQLVFERLGFADFQRAKSVCSSWHYASEKSSPSKQIPWLILFPEKGKDHCLLYNLEEKDKLYKIQDLGVNFANSNCLATYGNWFLMQDHTYNLYMLNIFARERIDLPSMTSQIRIMEAEQFEDDMFLKELDDKSDYLFWIDEKTKDYVVVWITNYPIQVLVYSRKKDKFWKQIEVVGSNFDMVYKDHKLYLYNTFSRGVKVLDFSEDIPRKIFEMEVVPCERDYDLSPSERDYDLRGIGMEKLENWKVRTDHLVVRVTGEILKVKSVIWNTSDVWSFRVYKMDSSNTEWEKIDHLEDEAIFLDLGITKLANTIEGVNGNSIYFSGSHSYAYISSGSRAWSEEDILIYNLSTHKAERPHRNICSSIQLSNARWFIPK